MNNFNEEGWEALVQKATMALYVFYHRALRTSRYVFKYGKEPIFEIDKKHNIQAKNYPLLEFEHAKKQNWEDYAKNNIAKER